MRRLCVEAHIVGPTFWEEVQRLRGTLFAARCAVRVMVRVREPVSWYISFYDWAILGRQVRSEPLRAFVQ